MVCVLSVSRPPATPPHHASVSLISLPYLKIPPLHHQPPTHYYSTTPSLPPLLSSRLVAFAPIVIIILKAAITLLFSRTAR
jgi:hypothetical protein